MSYQFSLTGFYGQQLIQYIYECPGDIWENPISFHGIVFYKDTVMSK